MVGKLQDILGIHLLHNEPLSRYTAARLGGPAEWLFVAKNSVEELAQVVQVAWSENRPVRVIGGGANVLVSDHGVPGLVVINRVSEIIFGDWHDGRNVSASSGASLTVLAHKCQAHGLSGLEWAVNVPGTVGGAVINNAGAHGGDMSGVVGDVVVIDARRGPHIYSCSDLAFEYRQSALKAQPNRDFVVLLATLNLRSDDPQAIRARMQEMTERRKRTQPPGASLGSIFKNPPGYYAGRLIEAAGLKGYTIGSVQVSPVHANFFMNTGQATASDYYALIQYVRREVEKHSGIRLELEIEIIGEMDDQLL
jgi:UDP-N-acetylmuramate dehydrogenase